MRTHHFYFTGLLIFSLFISSCKKEKTTLSSDLNIPVITGFQLRDDVGNLVAIYETPNIRLGDKSNASSPENNFYIESFPNPNYSLFQNSQSGRMMIYIDIKKPFQKASMWLERALFRENGNQMSQNFSTIDFVANEHLLEINTIHTGHSMLQLDVSALPAGFYRLYMSIDDVLLWDNLVLNRTL